MFVILSALIACSGGEAEKTAETPPATQLTVEVADPAATPAASETEPASVTPVTPATETTTEATTASH